MSVCMGASARGGAVRSTRPGGRFGWDGILRPRLAESVKLHTLTGPVGLKLAGVWGAEPHDLALKHLRKQRRRVA